jgi:hypothetical protein
VAKADELLMSGKVSSRLPDLRHSFHDGDDGLGSGGSSVMRNVQRAGFDIAQFNGNRYSKWVRDLKPGEVRQIFLPSDFLTSSYTITIDRVTPALPPGEQNQFWLCGTPGMEFVCGDDVFVHVVDAPTSFDVTRLSAFVNSHGPLTTTIANPQTGLVRVAVQGDWTNGGTVSALVTVTRQRRFDGLPTSVALIEQDEIDFVEVDVPGGAGSAVFELSWLQNWARYPTNDLELVLIDPAGNVIESGATANSPERVEVANPTAGRWTAAIIGFTIYGNGSHDADDDGPRKDVYTFRAEADGKRLKEVR